MNLSRVVFLILLSFTCVSTMSLHAEGFAVSTTTGNKIINLKELPSLMMLLTGKSDAMASSSVFFTNGLCSQSSLKDDGMYFLQIINDAVGLPSMLVPKNLVDIRPWIQTAGSAPICLTRATASQLYSMIESMKSEGLSLMVVSGYRSFADQRKLYSMSATALNSGSYDRVAPAGQSEHQLGTAIDVASLTRSGVAFASSSESDWIETHAHEYGFIISYGEANENRTGYMYEPWHLRYVGLENANILRAGEYTLSYKPDLYSRSWLNAVLTKLKELL